MTICCDRDWRSIELADRDAPDTGTEVLVLGYPGGLTYLNATHGIVSKATGTMTRNSRYMVITDADMNSGKLRRADAQQQWRSHRSRDESVDGTTSNDYNAGHAIAARTVDRLLVDLEDDRYRRTR